MALKNRTAKQDGYRCAWCGKSFSQARMTKSNGLDVCKACDTALSRKEGERLAKKQKAGNTTTNKLDKAQNAADAAGVLVTLAGAAIALAKILSKK